MVAVGGYDRPRSAIVAGWLAAAQRTLRGSRPPFPTDQVPPGPVTRSVPRRSGPEKVTLAADSDERRLFPDLGLVLETSVCAAAVPAETASTAQAAARAATLLRFK